MDLLKRNLAPILPEAWDEIDDEARRVLTLNLAGRKLVDFKGPHGWKLAAVNTGRLGRLDDHMSLREVQALIEVRTPFRLSIPELDAVGRGGEPDLEPVVEACERAASCEDGALFNGNQAAGIRGIVPASPHTPITAKGAGDLPRAVIAALETLRKAGIGGPHALALGPAPYDALFAARDDGYPIAKQVERFLDGPIVRAPALSGGVVLSTRGGDYELTVGQDLSVGYRYHDDNEVTLFVTESFTFRVVEEGAAVPLKIT